MAWTYSGNPGNSDLDEIRFMLGDTDPSFSLLTDEEIKYLLKQHDNKNVVAYKAVQQILTGLARNVTKSFGPERVQYSDMFKHFMALKDQFAAALPLDSFGYPIMKDPHDTIFSLGFMDNK